MTIDHVEEELRMLENKDIRLSTYVSGTEHSTIKQCRETLGLSESAFLRLAALRLVNQLSRQALLRESGLMGSGDSGRI